MEILDSQGFFIMILLVLKINEFTPVRAHRRDGLTKKRLYTSGYNKKNKIFKKNKKKIKKKKK